MGTEIPLTLLDLLPAEKRKELLEILKIMKEREEDV